ncbi:hypothetical protein C479_08138 [Halovivax asiaticus JCM 14624]|uniref:Uncharacterized protein n=1 Tax=Halovivax asiaticus JCM 14624 TaxID=1227490 RepID=M0BIS6_9EURY|nr:hypothetical protein [Halovivax asiaticus]ELZ10765.1 hypothetical protein C479_08138 [Halovivax asiaticus JCM 14624]
MTDRDSTRPPGTDSDDSPSSGTDERRPARDDPPATDTGQSAGDDGGTNQEADGDVKRRTYLQAIGAAGAAGAIGGVGLSGLGARSVSAQADPNGSVFATFCGTFAGGPQVQQCIACVEDECQAEDVNPLYPIVMGLTGSCFTPDTIPDGADYVTLKAGTGCYVAPVNGNTTFCLPPGSPDISNATFYSCGGDPTHAVTAVDVTCDQLTVTTENVADGTPITATVVFLDGDGMESEETYETTVTDDSATFDLPGDLNPAHLVLSIGDTVLYHQELPPQDPPCAEPSPPPTPDPHLEAIDITCDEITIATLDIPEGDELSVRLTFASELVQTYTVPVDADGVASIPLPGDLDPSHLVITYQTETLFNMDVMALDAPCAEPMPPEPPEPPEPPAPKPPKKEIRKKMMRHKRKYEKYKKMLEKSD